MRSVSYTSFDDGFNSGFCTCSRESSEYPLIVNCAGGTDIKRRFESFNRLGRLDYYLMYIVSGKLKVYLDEGEVYAEAGSFVIFPPKYKYRYFFSGNKTFSYYFVHFTGSEAERYLSELMLSPLPAVWQARASEEIISGFSDMFDSYARNDEFRDHAVASAFYRVLVALARAKRMTEKKPLISKSLTYLNAKYTDEIKIPELAAMEGLSVSRYNTVFKTLVGTSPSKYIIALRMKHACTLLSGTDLGINEIGSIVGYSDNHFFSKTFKNYVGISPQKYRNKSIEEIVESFDK